MLEDKERMQHRRSGEKLKIGILTKDLSGLQNYQYRIIQGIVDHPGLDLALFIKDGREGKLPSKAGERKLPDSGGFAGALFALHEKVEACFHKQKETVDSSIVKKADSIETIYLHPERNGRIDVFSDEESAQVKGYGLDIILQHEFGTIQGDILNAARYGIWNLYCADEPLAGRYAGFWEIVNNEPCCEVTLRQLTPESDGGLIIGQAWFRWYKSYVKTHNRLGENAVALLFKSIEKLLQLGKLETKKPLARSNKPDNPGIRQLLPYMARFYLGLLCNNRLFNKLARKRKSAWALFFGKGIFTEAALDKISPMAMPKNTFRADPFLCEYDNDLYVFFENFPYKTRKGKISVGRIAGEEEGRFSIVDMQDALDLDYHLSYPQIVSEDGEIFMIPETGGNKRLEIYRCVKFPASWELYAAAFDGEKIVDTTYFCDDDGNKWIFVNKGSSIEAELHIYKIDSLKLESITPHADNPVFIDCRKGRSAGAIFKHEGEYCRPSQINTHGVYGRGLQISKIKKLTLEAFEDEPLISIQPDFRKGLVGIHHLHQLGDCFIFDACYKNY